MPRASSWIRRFIPRPPKTGPRRRPELLEPDRPPRGRADCHRHGHGITETGAFVASMLQHAAAAGRRWRVTNRGPRSTRPATRPGRVPDLDLTVRGAHQHRPAIAGPAGRTGQDRPQVDRRRPISTRRNQAKLRKALDREVQSCVNLVGVDLNTASGQLLGYVSGVGPKLAESILHYRNAHGASPSRQALRGVPRLGGKAFQQEHGFLRVRGGRQPLDNSAVHPESYYLVEKMAQAAGVPPGSLSAAPHCSGSSTRGSSSTSRPGCPPSRTFSRIGETGPRPAPGVPRTRSSPRAFTSLAIFARA